MADAIDFNDELAELFAQKEQMTPEKYADGFKSAIDSDDFKAFDSTMTKSIQKPITKKVYKPL